MILKKYGLYAIWVLSCLGTLGSLYIGSPTSLDWCQRMCLFPLIFMAGMAAWRGVLSVASYFIPQALFGLSCAFYQILLMRAPEWTSSFYSETVQFPLSPLVFGGIFLCILGLSVYLSRKAVS